MSESGLLPVLTNWIAETVGPPEVVRRQPGGNRRQAWELIAAGRRLFLRFDDKAGEEGNDPFTVRREAGIYRGLARTQILIPGLVAIHPTLDAMLVEHVPGTAAYREIADREMKQKVAEEYMRQIASLHALDPEDLDLGLGPLGSVADHIKADIRQWEELYRVTGRTDPLIEFAMKWLKSNIPAPPGRAVLVHGDAGPGNFLFQDGRVTALLDWELAHFGDPIEDLAWVSMRSVLEPIPDFGGAIRAYVDSSGNGVDSDRLNFHRAFVEWRIAIIRHRLEGADLGNSLMSRAINRRLLTDVLGTVLDQPLAHDVATASTETALTPVFDAILAMLQNDVLPSIADDRATGKAKSAARLVKYLREADRAGPDLEESERADLEALIGSDFDDLESGRRRLSEAIREGRISEPPVFQYLARQAGRDIMLMRGALGRLAERTFPSLSD